MDLQKYYELLEAEYKRKLDLPLETNLKEICINLKVKTIGTL